ncbi:MAG: Hsp20/alpha crystallin family protein [Gemmatimonadota bacterium]
MKKRFDWGEPWDSVSDAVNRVIEDFGGMAEQTVVQLSCRPSVALRKSTAGYALDVLVPGLARDQVDVALEGKTVIVSGEWPARADEDVDTLLRDEFPRGRFRRTVHLPEAVDADGVKAKLAGGILSVELPLSEPSQRTEIEVEEVDEGDEGDAS